MHFFSAIVCLLMILKILVLLFLVYKVYCFLLIRQFDMLSLSHQFWFWDFEVCQEDTTTCLVVKSGIFNTFCPPINTTYLECFQTDPIFLTFWKVVSFSKKLFQPNAKILTIFEIQTKYPFFYKFTKIKRLSFMHLWSNL